MPRHYAVVQTFTGGELDPIIHDRYDHPVYASGAKRIENMIIRPQGPLTRRMGSRRIATAKSTLFVRFVPFIVGENDGIVLEMGVHYIRFFGNSGQILVGGIPLEIVTEFSKTAVQNLQWAQSHDVMIMVTGEEAPHELIRLSDTEWIFRPIDMAPSPSEEGGFTPSGISLTLSDTAGTGVTVTASNPVFTDADDDRVLMMKSDDGVGSMSLTSITNDLVAVGNVTVNFASTNVNANKWFLAGSPSANLTIDKSGPVGAGVTMVLQRTRTNKPNLISGGSFPDLTSWTNASGPTIATGTATAGSADTALIDTAADFHASGVHPGHRVLNNTSTQEDAVVDVRGAEDLLVSTGGATWVATNTYTIKETGTAYASGNAAHLDGGIQGRGWIHQSFAVVNGVTYQVEFNVSDQPVSMFVGTAVGKADLLAEFSYDVGVKMRAEFTADGATAVLNFRNNQNVLASVSAVTVREYDVGGWRSENKGQYVKVNSGIVEITEVTSATKAAGVIRKRLTSADTALRGTWSLEVLQWTSSKGFPSIVTFFDERLWLGSTIRFPNRLWGSVIGIRNNFAVGTDDTDAVQLSLGANGEWMVGERYLIVGASKEEFLIRGSTGNTITPTSLERGSPSSIGSTHQQPLRMQSAILFVQRNKRRIRELSFTEVAEQRSNYDRSIRSEHITAVGIARMAYQQEPVPIVWVVMSDGTLASMTYISNELIFGWARHPVDGLVKDVTVIPHPDGDRDQVWLCIDWQVPGMPPSIEYLEDGAGFYGQCMTDSTLIGTFDPPTTTVTGLMHLEGKTVDILVDGNAQSTAVVSGGTVTFLTAGELVEVGLPIRPVIEMLKPTFNQVPLTSLRVGTIRTALSLLNTNGIRIQERDMVFTTPYQNVLAAIPLFTGVKELTTFGVFIDDGLTITQELPYPFTLRAVIRTLEVEEP